MQLLSGTLGFRHFIERKALHFLAARRLHPPFARHPPVLQVPLCWHALALPASRDREANVQLDMTVGERRPVCGARRKVQGLEEPSRANQAAEPQVCVQVQPLQPVREGHAAGDASAIAGIPAARTLATLPTPARVAGRELVSLSALSTVNL